MSWFLDARALNALDLRQIDFYLRGKGWSRLPSDGNLVAWQEASGVAKVFIPLGEFSHSERSFFLTQLISTLASIEKRGQREVYEDLSAPLVDQVQVRRPTADRENTIPLVDASNIVHQGLDAITYSASSAISPRALFPSRTLKPVEDYIRTVRLAHTRPGSFVFSFHCPVPSLKSASELGELFDESEGEDPFGRKVTKLLCSATSSAVEVIRSGDIKELQDVVSLGVSANLCASLSGLALAGSEDGLEMNVVWSPGRPNPTTIRSAFTLTPEDGLKLKDGSEYLRKIAPEPDAIVRGYVIGLQKRRPHDRDGEVIVLDVNHGRPRKVTVHLVGAEYDIALEAHGDKKEVICTGTISSSSAKKFIERPGSFAIAPDSEDGTEGS